MKIIDYWWNFFGFLDVPIHRWKGQASYWSITVNGENHENCVWAYPNTKDGPAKEFEGYFAFYRRGGVEIVE